MPEAIEIYELLKPKIGELEAKSLVRFIEDRTTYLVREEIAKGLATKEDIARLERATREDIARLERATKEDIAEIRRDIWQMRLYLVAIGVLVIVTNPKVLELFGRLLGIVPR